MPEGRVQRKLAAILCADVQGYSRLMGADEEGTLRALAASRKIFFRQIERYRGRVVNAPGDSVLAEFPSVVDAVGAAVEIQRGLAEEHAAQPEEQRMVFRIGVNLGDVMVEDDAIYGDGVNIAARLEALADGGGVCISGSVYDQVKNKLDFTLESLGEKKVKNIAEPVRAYRVVLPGGGAAAQPQSAQPKTSATAADGPPPLPEVPSIAVLAFNNMSGDPEQEYFSDGISEDIITDLAKISGLLVIARNSSFAYKGRSVDLRQVGRELGVRYVLEGSVRKGGDRARITAQLIEARTGAHLWAERYDRKLEDVFAVQDEITEEIVTALDVKLARGEQARIWRKALKNPEARDLFYRAREAITHLSRERLAETRRLYQRVVELEPESPAGYVGEAWIHWWESWRGWSDSPQQSMQRA
ncbi:MAG: adenylate/guanylate cyclase domain-containing protein, partial [bacterium]